jgi:hypothetical protein
MSIQKLYTVGGNLATLYNCTTALGWNDPDWYYRLYSSDTTGHTAKNLNGEYVETFQWNGNQDLTTLEILNDNAVNAQAMFYDCSSLSALPDTCFNSVTNAHNMFYRTLNLSAHINSNMFNNVMTADGMFYKSNILSIGDNCFNNVTSNFVMLDECPALSSIGSNCFTATTDGYAGLVRCNNLKYIGDNVFPNVSLETDQYANNICLPSSIEHVGSGCFTQTVLNGAQFSGYTNLEYIGDDTFKANSCSDASYLFADCTALTHVPSAVFNRNFIYLDHTFENCKSLTGSIIDFIQSITIAVSHQKTFAGCTAMSDYAQALQQYPDWF